MPRPVRSSDDRLAPGDAVAPRTRGEGSPASLPDAGSPARRLQEALSARLRVAGKRSPRASMLLVLTFCGLSWAAVLWVVLRLL